MLRPGGEAPDFEALDQEGKVFRLSENRGSWVVLYFYPRDETVGCIAEACAFRDSVGEIASLGAKVVGVSTQSVESHRAFSEHHHLNFTLVADEDKSVSRLYEALGIMGIPRRLTYVIGPNGIIADAYRSEARPRSHIERVRGVLLDKKGRA